VWPGGSIAEPGERKLLAKGYRIGLSFAQRVSKATVAEIDALADLVTEVADFLELTQVVAGGINYVNQGWEYLIRFDDSQLDRNKDSDDVVRYTGLFASVIVFDFTSLE